MKNAVEWEDAVFYAALKVEDPAQRKVFLDQACVGDSDLRATVEEMLTTHAEAEQFFQDGSSALELSADSLKARNGGPALNGDPRIKLPDLEQLGSRIGRYKLTQKIGEGGGGSVYLAEQDEPVRRTVALKIIKLGMDTRSVVARFGAERQALALMDHPNIARALDAGATETGRPYFVMELVRGVKVTEYCDQQRLDLRRRLDLFIQICHAVQHAHQKGVIHRDLKPSNILVADQDGVPVPKVIDFGIAKAMSDQRLSDKTVFTACAQFMGTPAYMSPEQAQMQGTDVDTRSDIYSLGVLLYELLTGKTPFDPAELMNSGMDELCRILREKEPLRPSVMLGTLSHDELAAVAGQRRIDPSSLIGLERGDLDWIVMKTLEKDRARRYETASELALDVQRFLQSEPVLARPPSRIYQFQKMVRRNQLAFAAAAAVALALLLGISVSTWLYLMERTARQEAEQAQSMADELRGKAQAREYIAKAAVAVNEERFADAEGFMQLSQSPIAYFYPSLEAAHVFRSIGVWQALHERWHDAAGSFSGLLQINRLLHFNSDAVNLDLSIDFYQAGVSMLQDHDSASYATLRREQLQRLAGQIGAVPASLILRGSLLLPPRDLDPRPLAMLAYPVEQALGQNALASRGPDTPWHSFALALLAYRQQNWAKAVEWGQTSLAASQDNPAHLASTHLLLAMCHYRLGHQPEAQEELAQASAPILAKFKTGLTAGADTEGNWTDWAAANILLSEADRVIGSPPH